MSKQPKNTHSTVDSSGVYGFDYTVFTPEDECTAYKLGVNLTPYKNMVLLSRSMDRIVEFVEKGHAKPNTIVYAIKDSFDDLALCPQIWNIVVNCVDHGHPPAGLVHGILKSNDIMRHVNNSWTTHERDVLCESGVNPIRTFFDSKTQQWSLSIWGQMFFNRNGISSFISTVVNYNKRKYHPDFLTLLSQYKSKVVDGKPNVEPESKMTENEICLILSTATEYQRENYVSFMTLCSSVGITLNTHQREAVFDILSMPKRSGRTTLLDLLLMWDTQSTTSPYRRQKVKDLCSRFF